MQRLACLPVVLALATPLYAQSDLHARIRPITTRPKHAGMYHLATGTWTRDVGTASLGAAVVYDNTCPSGYYAVMENNASFGDEGRLPSPTGPSNAQNQPGCATAYTIDGFEIGYCSTSFQPLTANLTFYGSYTACASFSSSTPVAAFTAQLPSNPGASGLGCWTVTIDLAGSPGVPFVMQADGNGVFDGAGTSANLFGWTIALQAPGAGDSTGPMIAGDFATCSGYDGTIFDPVVNLSEAGTGMSTLDSFRIESVPPHFYDGCHWFGGDVLASFHLELRADACAPLPASAFCFSDEGCPCGNAGASGHGCANSQPQSRGAALGFSGDVQPDTLVLHASEMLPTALCIFLQGDAIIPPAAFGDGVRCTGGQLRRLATKNAAGGAAQFPDLGDPSISAQSAALGDPIGPGSIRYYQTYYRDPITTFCPMPPGNTWNVTNGIAVSW